MMDRAGVITTALISVTAVTTASAVTVVAVVAVVAAVAAVSMVPAGTAERNLVASAEIASDDPYPSLDAR